jgi:hypothetical protein
MTPAPHHSWLLTQVWVVNAPTSWAADRLSAYAPLLQHAQAARVSAMFELDAEEPRGRQLLAKAVLATALEVIVPRASDTGTPAPHKPFKHSSSSSN